MRLLFVAHQFFPRYYTGTERLTLDLSKQMQKVGHSVTVLTYGLGEGEGYLPSGDFLVKRYRYQGISVISIKHKKPTEELDYVVYDPSMEKLFKTVLPFNKFDLVHILHPMRVGGTVGVMAAKQQIPLVVTLTDFWLMCPKGIAITKTGDICLSPEGTVKCVEKCYSTLWEERLKQRLAQTLELLGGTTRVISATNSMKQVFEHGGLAFQIKKIPFGEDYNGVVPNFKSYSKDSEITLGFMSTLRPHKGSHVLLEAYNLARKRNIKLRIYGDYFRNIDYYNNLQKLAGHNSKIEFYGAYKYEDMTRIYNEIDMLVVPSTWWENSPLVLSRALAHKVPAIVSNLGGMTEVVENGVNGFSFEVSNPKSLALILEKIANDPTVLNELKKNIHRPPRIEEMAFEYEKIYKTLYKGN
jgi:glycosyltransferase involved in cell wall biosynthesis